MVALTAVAAARRRGVLPTDGLWFDDSWVAAGAVFGVPSQILSVGSTHPTFTLSLMGIDRLGGGDQAFVVPALVAGVLAPVLLFALAAGAGSGPGRPASPPPRWRRRRSS